MDILENAVHELISKKLIPHLKPGVNRTYFNKEEIYKWLMGNKIKMIKEEREARVTGKESTTADKGY